MSLSYRIEKNTSEARLFLTGRIDEDSGVLFAKISEEVSFPLIINFKGVEMINSCGVREWIGFIRPLSRQKKISFEECTPVIVSQINMLPSFKGTATIKSLYTSYACDDCASNELYLFELGKNMPTRVTQELPAVSCKSCGSRMEMEEDQEEVFYWLES